MKSIYKIITCVVWVMLPWITMACSEDDTTDTSSPVLVTQNLEDGSEINVSDSLIDLVFSKPMRQAIDKDITFDGKPIRIWILNERVYYRFSGLDEGEHVFHVPAGGLTDMAGKAYSPEISIKFTVNKGGNVVEGRVYDAIVDANGNGDYKTVTEAIASAPSNSTKPYLIYIANGTYNEWLKIEKPYLHLVGESRDGVKIQFASNRVGEGSSGWPYSCGNPDSPLRKSGANSDQYATVVVKAKNCIFSNLSIINLYGASSAYEGGLGGDGQAEALLTYYDRFVLNNVKLVSFQDTWWMYAQNTKEPYRLYAANCYIEGHTDYIWGAGDLLCENSTLYNKVKANQGSGSCSYITANRATPNVDKYGYIFDNCTITGDDVKFVYGRLQTPSTNLVKTSAKVVFMNSKLEIPLYKTHWIDGTTEISPGNKVKLTHELFGEYNNKDKDGNDCAASVAFGTDADGLPLYSTLLTAAQAASYSYDNIIKGTDGWDPKAMLGVPAKPGNIKFSGSKLTWDAVSGAAGYIIYADGKYAGQTPGRVYIRENTSASITYTVKAVSKYGMISE